MKAILKNAKNYVTKKSNYAGYHDTLTFKHGCLITSNFDDYYKCKDSRFNNISGTVSFSKFEKIAKKLKFDFQLLQNGDNLELHSNKGVFSLALSENDWDIPFLYDCDDVLCTFDSTIIKNINKAFKFVANDPLRPVMNHVCVAANGNVVGSDLNRLFYPKHDLQLDSNILIKDKILFSECKVYTKNRFVILESGFESVFLKLESLNFKYPNYLSVIPNSSVNSYKINKQDLIEKLDIALLAANPASNKLVFDFDFDNVSLNSQDIDFGTSFNADLVKCNFKLKIGFKGSLLIEILKEIDNDMIELKFNDPSRPFIINDVVILMPMML